VAPGDMLDVPLKVDHRLKERTRPLAGKKTRTANNKDALKGALYDIYIYQYINYFVYYIVIYL
jgi:hypothetical protein